MLELPTARLMHCSRSSRRDASSLAAASLKAEGLDVAKDNRCATVCEITNALAGWVGTFVVSNKEMVGSKTPRTLGPINNFNVSLNKYYLYARRCSAVAVKREAKAFQTSMIDAAFASEAVPSYTGEAIFAINSIRPGTRSLVH